MKLVHGKKKKGLDPNTVDMADLFDTLIEAVDVFRGPAQYTHPQANYKGCVIATPRRKRWCRTFAFVARGGQEVVMEIDFRKALLNPELYFDHLMEHLDKAMRQINATGKVIVLPERKPIAATIALPDAINDSRRG